MKTSPAYNCLSQGGFDKLYDYKLGCSKGNVNLVLLGAGLDKEKYYDDILCTMSNSKIESLFNKPLNDSGANQKRVIGDMSVSIDEFSKLSEVLKYKNTREILDKWEEFYTNKYPNGIKNATKILYEYFAEIQSEPFILSRIEIPNKLKKTWYKMCEAYVKRLALIQTPFGLLIEKMILTNLSNYLGINYIKDFNEEAKGIDARIDNIPITVKPDSYRGEGIATGLMIKYCKSKDDLHFIFHDKIPDEWIEYLIANSHNKIEINQLKKLTYINKAQLDALFI